MAEQQWYRQDLQKAKDQSYEEGRARAEQQYLYEIQMRDEHIRREEEGCQKFERVAADVIQENHSLRQENEDVKKELYELKKKLEDRKEGAQVPSETQSAPVVQPERSEAPEPIIATPVQQPLPQNTLFAAPTETNPDSSQTKTSTKASKTTPASADGSNASPSADAGQPKPVPTSTPETTSNPAPSSSTSKATSPPPSHSSTALPSGSQSASTPLESDFDALDDCPSKPNPKQDLLWQIRIKYNPSLVSGEGSNCADDKAAPNTHFTGDSRSDDLAPQGHSPPAGSTANPLLKSAQPTTQPTATPVATTSPHPAPPTNFNGTDQPSYGRYDSQPGDPGAPHSTDAVDDCIMADLPTETDNDVPMPDTPPAKLCSFIAQQPPPMLRGPEARRKRSLGEDDASSSKVKRIQTAHPRPEFWSESKDAFKKRQALTHRARSKKRNRVMLCDRPSHESYQWYLTAAQRMDYWYDSDNK